VEFLVEIRVELPGAMPVEEREPLLAAELARGHELKAAGKIKAIWRVPGGIHNVGVWEALDATELHELLESLPVYPWMSAEVTALAQHPLNRD
jgi:muconolactone D-isomerase